VKIAGDVRTVNVVRTTTDYDAIFNKVALETGPLAIDVEATGLDIFSSSYSLRTIQIASMAQAWVFLVEEGDNGMEVLISSILASRPVLLAHNASYDLLALDRFQYLDLEEAWSRTVDTYLLAHLLDPRAKADGGPGHKLEALAAHYLGDPGAWQYHDELMDHFRAKGWKIKSPEGYCNVDIQLPLFHQYGAVDVLHTAWLFEVMAPLIKAQGLTDLSGFEHEVARLCSKMQRKGIAVDAAYAPELGAWLDEHGDKARQTAATWGVDNVNSTAQVASAFQTLGVELIEKTDKGNLCVDKDVLEGIENLDLGPASELAKAVSVGKSMGRFRKTYVNKVMDTLGADGRSHPSINSLRARTARMAVSDPPLHQIPANDWRVRRLFIASPGCLMGSSDYSQVELRVLGALAKEPAILQAIKEGIDLHDLTAQRVGISRKLAKMTNFLICFGGGAKLLAQQAGITLVEATAAIRGWKRVYPKVARYSKRLIDQAGMGRLAVTTATGRRIPLDRSRIYAATNYTVQSTARDLFCQSLLNLEEAGLSDFILLPIHDEFLFEAPEADIKEVAQAIGEVMTMEAMGVLFEATGEVYGPSWGHGYGAMT